MVMTMSHFCDSPVPADRARFGLSDTPPAIFMKRILLLDDYPIIEPALVRLLRELSSDVEYAAASTLKDALHLLTRQPFDLLLFEIAVPGCGSIDIVREIRSVRPDVRLLVLTRMDGYVYALPYLRAGVNGFLSKNADLDEIRLAITLILFRGERYVSQDTRNSLLTLYSMTGLAGSANRLSEREFEVLGLLTLYAEPVRIGAILGISPATVTGYRNRIFQKIKVRSISDFLLKFAALLTPGNTRPERGTV